MTIEELLEEIKAAGNRSAQQMVATYRDNNSVQFWRGNMAMAEGIIAFYESNKGEPKPPTDLKVVPKEEPPVESS